VACHPGLVTGYVDGELPPARARHVGHHLSGCPLCAAQAVFEIDLRDRLRSLPAVSPPGLSGRVLTAARADVRLRVH
jgi:anti-sigma factor RsiW